jgi:outer membrane protein TolC
MEQNLDLKALALQVRVAKEMVTINRSDYYPTIAAFGQWQNQGQSESLSNWYAASSTVVGLNFTMNLFDGLRTSSRVEQASIDYKTAQQRYDQVLELLKLQVRASLNDVRSAKLRIDAQKKSMRCWIITSSVQTSIV